MQGVLNFLRGIFLNGNEELSILDKCIKIVIIFLLIKIGIKIFNTIIDKFIERNRKLKFGMDDKRANTLAGILKNLIKYVFYFIGLVPALELFGIKTSSILATAGIGGLAIGFGAQSLVKDIITGFFILFEDQFSVGDYIKVNGYEGIVEEMGLRVTKVRDFSGELHIIPNSNIQIVTNSTKGAMRALVDVNISYKEDVDRAIQVLEEICRELRDSEENIVEGPTVLGVSKLGEYDIGLTIVAKTKPMEQWGIERLLRKKIKQAFDEENIEIPYSKRVVIEKEK